MEEHQAGTLEIPSDSFAPYLFQRPGPVAYRNDVDRVTSAMQFSISISPQVRMTAPSLVRPPPMEGSLFGNEARADYEPWLKSTPWTFRSSIISELLELWAANQGKRAQMEQTVPIGSNVQKLSETSCNMINMLDDDET